jgi:hypothetical protein
VSCLGQGTASTLSKGSTSRQRRRRPSRTAPWQQAPGQGTTRATACTWTRRRR